MCFEVGFTSCDDVCSLYLNSDAESTKFDRGAIFFGGKKNTMWFDITVNDVIFMTVSQCIQNLSHVMAVNDKTKNVNLH